MTSGWGWSLSQGPMSTQLGSGFGPWYWDGSKSVVGRGDGERDGNQSGGGSRESGHSQKSWKGIGGDGGSASLLSFRPKLILLIAAGSLW